MFTLVVLCTTKRGEKNVHCMNLSTRFLWWFTRGEDTGAGTPEGRG